MKNFGTNILHKHKPREQNITHPPLHNKYSRRFLLNLKIGFHATFFAPMSVISTVKI